MARCGSMKAAANELDVAQPTVWKQIHAMEQTLGVALVEASRDGSKLTEAGRLLLRICGPAVHEIDGVESRFKAEMEDEKRDFIIATSPRVCYEDLPPVISKFKAAFPWVRLCFRELSADKVVELVESGEAHVGLSDIRWSVVPEELTHQFCYGLESIIAIPAKHELAKKKRVQIGDLAGFPILNAPNSYPCEEINRALELAGVYSQSDQHIELCFAQTILRYVQLGLGIGIVGHPVGFNQKPLRGVVEHSLSGQFENLPVHAIYRVKTVPDPVEAGFIEILSRHYSNTPRNAD